MHHGRGFINGWKTLWFAVFHCDGSEHIECAACDREYNPGWDFKVCPACEGELTVRVERKLMADLAWGEIKRSVAPYTLTEWSSWKDEVRESLYWRGRLIRERQVPNVMKTRSEDE